MDVKETRRLNMLGLATALSEGVIARFARKTGQDEQYLRQIKNGHREMGDEVARAIEGALNMEKGWMDRQQFANPEEAMIALEVEQIRRSLALSREDLDAWLKHGRVLVKNLPRGPNNPFGNAPMPKGGTQ